MQTRLDRREAIDGGHGRGVGRSAVKRSVNRVRRFYDHFDRLQSRKEHRLDLFEMDVLLVQEEDAWPETDAEQQLELELSVMTEVKMMQWKGRDTDLDVSSDCSSTTCGSDDTTVCMSCSASLDELSALSSQPSLSPWEVALIRAEQSAKSYMAAKELEQRKADEKRRKEKKPVLSKEEAYLRGLSKTYGVEINYKNYLLKQEEKDCPFEKFRRQFFEDHAEKFFSGLQPLYQQICGTWMLNATPVSPAAQKHFLGKLEAQRHQLTLAFHGTRESVLDSIYQNGLLVPGLENHLTVHNGSAYGCGVYCAKGNCAEVSWSYARGDKRPMLVCAALDGENKLVRHLPNFMVVFQNHRVIPLFEATLPPPASRTPPPTAPGAPTGAAPGRSGAVQRRQIEVEQVKVKGPGPRTRLQILRTPRGVRVVGFLSRRAARTRRA